MEKEFLAWLEETQKISESSCKKYTRAIRAISKDMLNEQVVDKELYNITLAAEFERIMKLIFNNSFFDKKDTTGNRMYSVAMKRYLRFLQEMECKLC